MADDSVEVSAKQVDELVARLTAVRGALQDHLEDNPIVFDGVPALLDFVEKICHRLKEFVLGQGSTPLQELLVRDVGDQLAEVDIAKHFTMPSFESKIRTMNGYQSHVVSPELAIRALIADAFADAVPIAQWMVVQVKLFLSQRVREAADEVAHKDPQRREQLANLIVGAVDQVLEEWEKEAIAMADVVIEMEQTYLSPVFFHRLAIKRKEQSERMAAADPNSGAFANGMRNVAASGRNLLSRIGTAIGRRAPGEGGAPRRRPSSAADAGDDDAASEAGPQVERSSGSSLRPRSSAPALPPPGDRPGPPRNMNFTAYIQKWDPLGFTVLNQKDGTKFQVLRGKMYKRAHGGRLASAVTKTWDERHFVFDYSSGDIYYWKEQPTKEFMEANRDSEKGRGTRVVMSRARVLDANMEDMKGYGGQSYEDNQSLGVKLTNVYVKQRFDTFIVAFSSLKDKRVFFDEVSEHLRKMRADREGSVVEEEEVVEEEAGVAPETPSPRGSHSLDGDEAAVDGNGADGDSFDGDAEADTPTAGGYKRGGLGMGSPFFNAEDIRTADGDRKAVSTIMVPSQFRSPGGLTESTRVEGSEVLQWLTHDMSMYVTIVSDTIAATLPKVAVMVMVERIVKNELQRRLQRKALDWSNAAVDMVAGSQPLTMPSKEATVLALADIEAEMVTVRMASGSAAAAAAREGTAVADVRCTVSVRALALGGYSRVLSAAQKPSPGSYVADAYGPLFPEHALEAAETAAKRYRDAADFDRTATVITADPLAPADGGAGMYGDGRDYDATERSELREGKRTGAGAGVIASVVNMAGRMGEGFTGRKRVTDRDVEDEHRAMAMTAARAPPARAPPARAPVATAPARSADPLAGGDPLAGAASFGADPLAAPVRQVRPSPTEAGLGGDSERDDDDDDNSGPLRRSSLSQSRMAAGGVPGRAPPPPPRRAAPAPMVGRAPAAPPRRAPPAPGMGPARAPPPAPGVGRPMPVRTAPAAPPRGPPMRPRTSDGNLPL